MTAERATDTVYVVFEQGASPAWWDAFCNPALRHCWMFGPTYSPDRSLTAIKSTIVLEPVRDYLALSHWNTRPEIAAAEIVERPEVSALVGVRIERPPRGYSLMPGLRGLMSCVSVLKYALGVRAPFVWTPSQLCDYLLEHCGGELIRRVEHGQGGQRDIRGRETEGGPGDCGEPAPAAGSARQAGARGGREDQGPTPCDERRLGGPAAPL